MYLTVCVYFLLIVAASYPKGSSSVEVTPSTVSVCPGQPITIKCTTSTTTVQWTVTPNNNFVTPISLGFLTLSNNVSVHNNPAQPNLVFRAELTSLSPPCSTFMATALLALNNAQVTCASGTDSSDTATIIMNDTPAIRWINITSVTFREDSATAAVEWNGSDQTHDSTDFFVMITPPVNGSLSNFTTNTSSHQLTIPYNSQHTITVTATNCVGNTNTLNKTFKFVQCQHPKLAPNISVNYSDFLIEDSQIFFSCPQGQILSNRDITSATCTSTGVWSPDPTHLQCEYCEGNCGTSSGSESEGNKSTDGRSVVYAIPSAVSFTVIVGIIFTLIIVVAIIKKKRSVISHFTRSSKHSQNYHRDNTMASETNESFIVYAELGPSKGNNSTSLLPESYTVEYSQIMPSGEAQNTTRSVTTNQHGQEQKDKPRLNLDNLLFHLRPQVIPKWYQLAITVGTPKELLDELKSYPEDECVIEIADYWLRHHPGQLTWVEVANALREIQLHQLAEELTNGPMINNNPEWIKVPSVMKPDSKAISIARDECSSPPTPPPLPPRVLDKDEEMDQLIATKDSASAPSYTDSQCQCSNESSTGKLRVPSLNDRASFGADSRSLSLPPRPPKSSAKRCGEIPPPCPPKTANTSEFIDSLY